MKCLLFIRLRFTTITNCNLQICSDNRAYLVRKQEQKRGMIVLDQTNANIERYIKTHSVRSDDDRSAVDSGGLRKSLEGGLSRKSWEKNKSLLWSLTIRKRYKKKPVIGLITGFFGGGDGGIRTHDPQGASWFRVMSVMTTSIRLRILVIYLVYCTCFLCDCQAKLHIFVNFKFNP